MKLSPALPCVAPFHPHPHHRPQQTHPLKLFSGQTGLHCLSFASRHVESPASCQQTTQCIGCQLQFGIIFVGIVEGSRRCLIRDQSTAIRSNKLLKQASAERLQLEWTRCGLRLQNQ